MSFWAPVLHATDEGHQLRALADAFMGRHVVPRYRGYMESQAMRLLGTRGGGHGRRGGGQRVELLAAHGYDTKYAMHCARLGLQCIELLTTRQLQLPIRGEPADWLRAVRRGEVPFAEWQQRWQALDAALKKLAADETYPARPDTARIERWASRHTSSTGALAQSIRRTALSEVPVPEVPRPVEMLVPVVSSVGGSTPGL